MPLWAAVHRPPTVQPSLISFLIIVKAFRANSAFVGFSVASVVSAAWLSAQMRICLGPQLSQVVPEVAFKPGVPIGDYGAWQPVKPDAKVEEDFCNRSAVRPFSRVATQCARLVSASMTVMIVSLPPSVGSSPGVVSGNFVISQH